jgi:MATE family multidrug resistance protein
MGKNNIPLICTVIGSIMHIGWSYLFVVHLKQDIVGTGIASAITNFTILVMSLVYTSTQEDIKEAVFWPDYRSFRGLGEYLKIGIPQTALLCLEWWVFEICTLLAGLFGNK